MEPGGALKDGRRPRKRYDGKVDLHLYLDSVLWDAMYAQAVRNRRSLTAMITVALEQWLAERSAT